MRTVARAVPLAALLTPFLAFAATTPQTFQQLANQIVSVIGSATTDLIILAVVVYLWGAASNLFKGEKGQENLRKQLLWGIFVIFLAVSIWGVVQLLQSSVFGAGSNVTNGGGGSSGTSGTCTSLNCGSPFGGAE
jgi:Na+-driven multidrug efflux pump